MRALATRLDSWARNLSPMGLALVLVLTSLVPTGIPGMARVAPVLLLVAVYHWALYRPKLFPAVAVFCFGLLQDLLSGAPVGMNALVLLTVFGLVRSQRRFLAGKTFFVYWLGFAIISLVAMLETWALMSAYYLTLVGFGAFFAQYLLMLGIFPIIAWLFIRWQRAFLEHA